MAQREQLVETILNELDDAREGIDTPDTVEFPNNVQAMLEERPKVRDDSFIALIIQGSMFR